MVHNRYGKRRRSFLPWLIAMYNEDKSDLYCPKTDPNHYETFKVRRLFGSALFHEPLYARLDLGFATIQTFFPFSSFKRALAFLVVAFLVGKV